MVTKIMETTHVADRLASKVMYHWAKLLSFLLTSGRCVSYSKFTLPMQLTLKQDVIDIFGDDGKYNMFGQNANFLQLTQFEPAFVIDFLEAIKDTGNFDLFDRMRVCLILLEFQEK